MYIYCNMSRLFYRLLLIVLFSTVKYGLAQGPVYYVKTLTVENGLPQSYVSNIVQDSNGFLWTATLNGLGRYDGREFKLYQHTMANKNSISGNIILRMFLAKNNWLWLCYEDGKIDLFNTVTEKIIRLTQKSAFRVLEKEADNFKSMVGDTDNHFWMLAHDGGVFELIPDQQIIRHFSYQELKLNEPVVAIACYQKKLAWLTKTRFVFAKTGQYLLYPFQKLSRLNGGLKEQYKAMVRKNGDILIIDSIGLKIWNPITGNLKQLKLPFFEDPNKSLTVLTLKNDILYFSIANIIYQLNSDNILRAWIIADQNKKGKANSMYIDQSGVVWVGTNGYGLRQYNQLSKALPGYMKKSGFVSDVLLKTGYDSAAIQKTVLKYQSAFSSRNTTCGDSLWIGEAYQEFEPISLALVTSKEIKSMVFKNSNSKDGLKRAIRFLGISSSRELWGISQDNNLLKFDTKNLSYIVQGAVQINRKEFINGLIIVDGHQFFISTQSQFLLYDLKTQRTTDLTARLPTTNILCAKQDPIIPNLLWIGTLSDGLISYDMKSGAAKSYNNLNGLPNNTIYAIIPHGQNELWCSSNRGIFSFQKDTKTIRSFTSLDGLPNDEFNNFEYMTLPQGLIAFGGPMGYTLFNPAQISDDSFNPNIVITNIEITNQKLSQPFQTIQRLNLKHDQNFINITFAATQFDIPQKLKYRYKLKGLNEKWIDIGGENRASYTSLPPGNYVFMVNASNTSGRWSSHIKQISISIAPPFWNTWWFYLCCLLCVGLFIYLFLRSRIRKIKQVQQQKLDFERESLQLHAMALRARMNPHFIFNCLNSIKALIQQNENTKAVNYLTTFSTLIRNQLNNNGNEISLAKELATCKLYMELEALRFENYIAYEINIQDENLIEITMIPPLTLQPFIENAIVHGLLPSPTGGKININIYREDEYIVCCIEDNGIGRVAAMANKEKSRPLHQSQGIGILAQRINLYNNLNGSMSAYEIVDLYEGEKAKGTLVIIKFNIDEP